MSADLFGNAPGTGPYAVGASGAAPSEPEALPLWDGVEPEALAPPATEADPEPAPILEPAPVVVVSAESLRDAEEQGRRAAEPLALYGHDLFGNPIKPPDRGKIATTFTVPPFSVLNAREGFWQDRKRAWIAAGIRAEQGRSESLLAGHQNSEEQAADLAERYGIAQDKLATGGGVYTQASSIFDPVLCELAYKWWCPPGGSILDPFAGESTKGIVAAILGYPYTGCELRPEQVEANRAQAATIGVEPTWVCADSSNIGAALPPGALYDFVWTSPPYYDLEIYSESDKDGSAFATYPLFMEWYELVFSQCVARLRPNRFLAVKVGEIRDERGVYRNFVGDNITCFRRLGLHYYNEVILVTSAGSLPIRIGKQFQAGRKVGKCHQNVLAFWKGEPGELKRTVSAWEIEAC